VDVYFSKTSTGTWEVAVYDQSSASITGGFPYSSGPIGGTTLTFDMTNGKLDGASATSVSIAVPDGQALNLDLSQMSQLATDYTVLDANVDGNAASAAEIVEISRDGYVYVTFDNGTRQALFRIPLGNVTSPDNMEAVSGNAFTPTSRSGDLRIGFPGDAGYGELLSGVLEQSTTDIASEFTDMIDAQRSYTANSKVFQTGAELMDVLVNLKR
jgi:flagellar hook protein FlgE